MTLPKGPLLRRLLFHVEERQRIYLRRQAGEPWPWTKDLIFQRFRFCETYREQDRVTKWIRENWREPYKDHPDLWFAMAVARQINWPDTLAEIGFPGVWDSRKVLRILNARRKRGEKVFTSAYLLGQVPAGQQKPRHLVMNVLNVLYRKGRPRTVFHSGATLQSVWEWLQEFPGWGKFLAYEVVTDLRHTRYLQKASDIYTWANTGPGAKRGLNYLYQREVKASVSQSQLLDEMRLVSQWIARHRCTDILPTWELRDTEHLLCEFYKRCRAEEREKAGRTTGMERFRPPGIV